MFDSGYFSIPRCLITDPIWQEMSLAYRDIFLTILCLAAFEPTIQNDHGVLIDLQPLQLMITQRQLAKLCKTTDAKIDRALKFFKKVNFSRHETKHIKTIITITYPAICEIEKIKSEARIDAKSRQDRGKIEAQKKKENKENKENNNIPSAEASAFASSFLLGIRSWNPKFKEPNLKRWGQDFDKILKKLTHSEIEAILRWLPTHDFWRTNVLAPSSIAKKYEKLHAQMISPYPSFTKEKRTRDENKAVNNGVEY